MANTKTQTTWKKTNNTLDILKRLSKNNAAIAGLIIMCIMILIAILAPVISPYPYEKIDVSNAYSSPTLQHPCGTDQLGRDILSRLIYGSKYSLTIGIFSVAVAVIVGVFIGSISGYFGGLVDDIIMRITDVVQAIPNLLLAVVISAVLGSGFFNSIVAVAIGGIPSCVRLMRASILGVRKMEYLEAATSINCSSSRIILKHVIPNAMSPMIVQATMMVAGSIMVAATLSFIGLGVQPPTPEWGAMLAAGRGFIRDYPYMTIFPGIFLMVTVLSLNMLGDGLRDALDPKLKK